MSDTHVLHVRPTGDLVGGDLSGLSVRGETTRIETVGSIATLAERLTADPDLVVTEYSLPGRETGLDVLSRVRTLEPDLPVVLCTADPDGEVASAATRLGVTEYVPRTGDGGPSLRERVVELLAGETRTDGGAAAARGYAGSISDVISDAVVTIDSDSDIVYANERFADLTGYDRSALLGSDFTRFMPGDADERHRAAVASYLRTGERSMEWEYVELTVLDADGRAIPVSVSFSEVERDGETYFTAVLRDVSERDARRRELERANTRLDLALESIDGGVFVWHAETNEIHWDDQTASLFGLSAEERTMDWDDVLAFVVPADRERLEAIVHAAEAGDEDHSVEYRIDRADGERRWLATDAEVVRDGDGAVERLVGITRDVTDRRTTAVELCQSQDALQRLSEITADKDRDFAAQLDDILALGCDRLDLPVGFMTEIESGTLEIVASHGDDSLPGHTAPLETEYCARTVDVGLAATADAAADEWASGPYERYGMACYIGGEVIVDGETHGTLCFASERSRSREFTAAEETFVELVTSWLSYELERRERERELRDAHDRKDQLLERIDDGFFAVDEDWTFTYFNGRAEDLLGFRADDVLGETVWDVFPAAMERAFYDEYHAAMTTQTATTFEEYVPSLSTWLSVSVYPSPDGLSVYLRDVTDRKRREQELERYETIVETIDDGVYALDGDGRFTFANEALAEVTGYDRTDLLGRHVGLLKDEGTVRLGEDVLGRLLSADERETTIEFDLQRADGTTVPCEDRLTLLPSDDDEFRGTVGVFRDISDHREREEILTGLLETTKALMAAPTKRDVANIVVRAARQALGFELNAFRLYDPDTDTLEPTIVTDETRDLLGERPTYSPGEGIPGQVYETGDPLVYDDTGLSDIDFGPVEAALCLPLGDHGTLTLSSHDIDAFDDADRQMAEILAANAEAALDRAEREQELERFETIMETVTHMVYVLDADGRFVHVTRPFAERLGYDRETLLGTDATTVLDSSDDAETVCDGIRRLLEPDGPESVELDVALTTGDGATFPAAVDVSLLPSDTFDGTVGVVRDVTELTATRERLADERDRFTYLFDNMPDAVVEAEMIDGDPIVRSTNDAFETVFGYEPEQVRGNSLNEYLLPDGVDEEAKRIDRRAAAGEHQQVEIRRQTADGERYFLFRGIPYADGDAGTRVFGIYTDVTDQHHRERQLEVLTRVLRHNIRNGLSVILGQTEELERRLDDDSLRSMAEIVQSKAREIASISEKSRQIERVVDQSVDDRCVDVVEIVRTVAAEYRDASPDAEITVDAPDTLSVRGDTRLEAAVGNLVENAIEHNDGPRPAVDIRVRSADGDAVVTVTDDGPGIPESERAIVSGADDITQLTHASGIGLWLVRWITEACGGEMDFEDIADGAAVSLRLDARPAD